jgi:hypothetical protein
MARVLLLRACGLGYFWKARGSWGSSRSSRSRSRHWQALAALASDGRLQASAVFRKPWHAQRGRTTARAQWPRAVVLHLRASRRAAVQWQPVNCVPQSDATAAGPQPAPARRGPAAPRAWPFRTEATRTPHRVLASAGVAKCQPGESLCQQTQHHSAGPATVWCTIVQPAWRVSLSQQ